MIHYFDFNLTFRKAALGYLATVDHSPVGKGENAFVLPFKPARLKALVKRLGETRKLTSGSTRVLRSPMERAARELGGQLFDAVFAGGILELFQKNLEWLDSQAGEVGLRLKLILQETPELVNIPWEFLFYGKVERYIGISTQTPIVRFLELSEPLRPIRLQLPLEILVVIASPSDYKSLDVQHELKLITKALEPLVREEKVRLTTLWNASVNALQGTLRRQKFHVFHFIGHGGFLPGTQEGALLLQNEEGKGVELAASKLASLFYDHPSLRLAVLNACEGARVDTKDIFGGVASALIRQRVPAVAAMQFEITDAAAIIFSQEFYRALVDGYPIDAAMAESRKAIFTQRGEMEWATPVLYMRAPDGVLFAIEPDPAVDAVKPQQKEPVVSTGADGNHTHKDGEGWRPRPPQPERFQEWFEQAPAKRPAEWTVEGLSALDVSRDGAFLATGTRKGEVKVILLSDGKEVLFQKIAGEVRTLAFSPDGTMLAVGTTGGKVIMNPFGPGSRPFSLPLDLSRPVNRLVFSADQSMLAALIGERGFEYINCWNVSDRSSIASIKYPQVNDLWFLPAGHRLSGIGRDGNVVSFLTDRWIAFAPLAFSRKPVEKVVVSPEGERLAYLLNKTVHVAETPQLLPMSEKLGEIPISNMMCLALSPKGKRLAVGYGFPVFDITAARAKTGTNGVEIWNVQPFNLIGRVDDYADPVVIVAWAGDNLLVTATKAGLIRLIEQQ